MSTQPQSAPSVLLYAQALVMLQDLQTHFSQGILQTPEDLSLELQDILARYEQGAGQPLLQFDPISEGEPPLSSKMNLMWANLAQDLNILGQESDILKAAAIFTHNFVATETRNAALQNAQVNNKIKTLQLYSSSTAPNVIVFGDTFASGQFMDPQFNIAGSAPSIASNVLRLGPLGSVVNLTSTSKVTILSNSNGFAGDNQEIENPTQAPIDPTTGKPQIVFLAEQNTDQSGQPQRFADTRAITDGEPNTWFEYEDYLVSQADRQVADNLNFVYSETTNSTTASGAGNAITAEPGTTSVDWASGPPGGALELTLQFDLGSVQTLNTISYVPYGLQDNNNYPVLIKQVRVSQDGTDWSILSPENVYVGTNVNLQAARTANNVTIGTALWSFGSMQVQFIRVDFEQSQSYQANIGHLYYTDSTTGNRTLGPVPPVTNPTVFYGPNSSISGNIIQNREYFVGERWAIGIRDFLAQQLQYQATSTMVTYPLRIPGLVDRVSLDAEVYVPSSFDVSELWVKFFLSPDNGLNWYQISRIEDNFLNVPEEISFNDPLPRAFQEPGVAYFTTTNPVNELRLKIVLSRPSDQPSSTPMVRSYKLRVLKK